MPALRNNTTDIRTRKSFQGLFTELLGGAPSGGGEEQSLLTQASEFIQTQLSEFIITQNDATNYFLAQDGSFLIAQTGDFLTEQIVG